MRRSRFPFPTSPPPYSSACERVQELSHFLRCVEYVVCRCGPPGDLRVIGATDEDAYSAVREGLEGVLVGDVVTQIERYHVVAVETQDLKQVESGFPLVPVELGLYLIDHLAGRNLQLVGVLGEDRIHDLFHSRPLHFGDEPEMCRDRGSLWLDQGALDGVQLLVEPRLYLIEQRLELGALLAPNGALWAPDVEAVAAGDGQVVEAHELLHHPPIAPADHAHWAPLGQPANGVPHTLGDDGVLWPVDYGCQRAVVVEEHGRNFAGQPPGQLVAVGKCMRQITDVRSHYPLLVSYQAKFCKVADNDVGSVLAEDLRVVAPGHADDEAEATHPARLYPGDGVFYHDGLLRERPEHAGGFFVGLGGGLAGELLFRGNVAVYSSFKEILNAGRLKHRVAVLAGGDHSDARASSP